MSAQLAPILAVELSPKPRVTEVDPFMYGWRERTRMGADGKLIHDRTPLTIHDVLHPHAGDFRVHTEEHERICAYLYDVLSMLVDERPDALVLHDTRVAWDVAGMKPHSPDISLIFNVHKRKNWSTFNVRREGTRPSLIIEVTSIGTRTLDIETKVEQYESVGIPYYIIVDLKYRHDSVVRSLIGYEMTPDGYLEMQPDDQGHLWIPILGASLAFEDEQLVMYDSAGVRIPGYKEVTRARRVAEAEARRSQAQARQAEAKTKQAETQAKQAEAQAAHEARIRAEVEVRLQQAEAELRRLRNQS